MSEEDDYNSSEDEDYVPDTGVDDVDEPSGDECDEVQGEIGTLIGGRGRRSKKAAAKNVSIPETSTTAAVDVDDFFERMLAENDPVPGATNSPTTSVPSVPSDVQKAVESTQREEEGKPGSSLDTEKSTITEVFDFAGDEIKIQREVTIEEARLHEIREQKKEMKKPAQKRTSLGNALTLLAKKPKMSVLDKSTLDWQSFKKEENIEEDLSTYNRGRNGFLGKQDFLQRADLAQFERERNMRAAARKFN